jgi:hypothetical protein
MHNFSILKVRYIEATLLNYKYQAIRNRNSTDLAFAERTARPTAAATSRRAPSRGAVGAPARAATGWTAPNTQSYIIINVCWVPDSDKTGDGERLGSKTEVTGFSDAKYLSN